MNRKLFFAVIGLLSGLIYWFLGVLITRLVETPWDWLVFMAICGGLGLATEYITRIASEGEKEGDRV